MRLLLLPALLLILSACGQSAQAPPQAAKAGGPPPMPPYQIRAEAPAGARTAAGRDGRALYSNLCGSCHLLGGMGTNVIAAQKIEAGQPPELALLENRTDLTADYVVEVARRGKGAMPPLTRVDATDAELNAIGAYLARRRP